MNPFLKTPQDDFNAIRDGRNSLPLYIDIDLSSARDKDSNTQLVIGIAGNSFYADADTTNGGNAVVTFQDTNLGESGAPFFISPGFIANVGFTQLLIENKAQAGKRLRIFYGVDIDFQAGVNSSIAISGNVDVGNYPSVGLGCVNVTVTNVSQILIGSSSSRKYLLIQNNHATGNIFVNFNAAATLTNCLKIGPGGSFELSGYQNIVACHMIGDIASNSSVIYVQGY